LTRQRDALEKATQAKSRFLAAASHDLRQPLHALGLFVARLTKATWPDQERRLIEHVEQSVESLQDLLDTLLDLSRLESGSTRVDAEEFDLREALTGVLHDFEPQAHDKQLGLSLRAPAAWTCSDRGLVERLVNNLVSNALRYTESGRILLACRRRKEHWRVEVWDTGIGIDPHHQTAIFEEYVQLGNAERDRRKGLGLGLSICRHVATLLSTKLGLRSVPGRGSVFWFDLPMVQSPAAIGGDAPDEASEILVSGTILVVEDDPLCLESTGEAIVGWGGDVDLAANADEALALAGRAPRYGAAVCDVHLPGATDGLALGIRLQQLQAGLPVILVSADASPILQAQARGAGFPLLRKPVAAARLRATLLGLLNADAAEDAGGADGSPE
jgi:CheY-like chemotaxis protein/two-component sensor histidine kinase